MLNKAFFDCVRKNIFDANRLHMDQTSVDCMNAIDLEPLLKNAPAHHKAYIFATAFHEARFEWYIRESGRGRGKTYGIPDPKTGYVYYGRGLSQVTWKKNYAKWGLENDPDKALTKETSVLILAQGMLDGDFTGKKLSDFGHLQNTPEEMFTQMRTIVNGTDKAEMIAEYALNFALALALDIAPANAAKPIPATVSQSVNMPEAKGKSTMDKLMMLPSVAASLIGLAVKYGPQAAESTATAVSNFPDIMSKGTDMIARLKKLDFPGAMVDFNAIIADVGITHEHVTTATATAAQQNATLSASIF